MTMHLIWAGLSALLFPVFVSDTSLAFSNSMFSVLLFVLLLLLLRHAAKQNYAARMKRYTHVLGLLFSMMTAFGYSLKNLGSVSYTDLRLIASIILYAHVSAQALCVLWSFLQSREQTLLSPDSAALKQGNILSAKTYGFVRFLFDTPLALPCFLLLCWAPCYLSTFPGNLIYDASYEYYQLANGFTRSFPLLHSAIITRLFSVSEQLTGSVNAGVAVYVVAQMLLSAALFSHILRHFHARGIHPALLGVLALYCAAFPVVHLLVTCTTRDVLFTLLLTWSVYLFYLLAYDPDGFMSRSRNVVLLALALALTLLSRNNNSGPLVAILLVALCSFVGVFFGRKYIRNVVLFVASALGLFLGINALLVALCQPLYESPPSSSMAILSQPIARAYVLHGDSWSEENRTAFETFFNMETFEYVPQNADPSKGNLQVRYANMREFLAFWVKIGLKHPGTYLDAFLATTHQMWFPASIPDGYNVRNMYPGYDKCYFYFGRYVEEIGSRENWLPAVFSFYENIGLMVSYEKIPVVSMLFSIGFQFWLLLHCVFYAAYRKCRYLFWPLAIVLVYTLCCMFVPLVLLRYFAALFLVFPMTIVFTLCPSRSAGMPEA